MEHVHVCVVCQCPIAPSRASTYALGRVVHVGACELVWDVARHNAKAHPDGLRSLLTPEGRARVDELKQGNG